MLSKHYGTLVMLSYWLSYNKYQLFRCLYWLCLHRPDDHYLCANEFIFYILNTLIVSQFTAVRKSLYFKNGVDLLGQIYSWYYSIKKAVYLFWLVVTLLGKV